MFVRLYVQYVRPHLEFSTPASCMGPLDRRGQKHLGEGAKDGHRHGRACDHEAMLKELGLQTLEERCHQADMCTVHKLMHGVGRVDYGACFDRARDSE